MKRKSVKQFIEEHRKEIDKVILKRMSNAKLTDNERRKWIVLDESLYEWARKEGVKI